MKNPTLLARKLKQARGIATRCREIELPLPRWVAHLLGSPTPPGQGAT